MPKNSREHLQKALDFLKEDQKELDLAPVDWDNINSIHDLFGGVSVVSNVPEVKGVKIQWNAVLGKCIRKNKLALGLYEKPEGEILSASKEDAQNLVARLCEAKLKPSVQRQLTTFQVMCA